MDDLLTLLTVKDDKAAFAKAKEIAAASEASCEYYPHLKTFASLLTHKSSYVRTRAFILCCSQARWDEDGMLGEVLPDMLRLLNDNKPTVVRQCLNALKEVTVFRPVYRDTIYKALSDIDPGRYSDSMEPLIRRDIRALRELMDE